MKEYITKLIDRNIQRKRESGITSYALYSILIILFYNILRDIPKIPLKLYFNEVLFILGLSLNLFFLGRLIFFMLLILTDKRSDDIKIFNKTDENNLLMLISLLGTVILGIINICLLNEKNNEYNTLIIVYLLTMTILYLICLISHFGVFFQEKTKKLNVKGNSTVDLKWFVVFCIISFTILFCVNIYILNNTKITVFRKYDVFLFCVYLFGVFLVLLKIIYESNNDNYLKSLENLEYEIYTKKLGDNEIKNRLQTNYFGFLFQDWIEKKYEELKDFEDYIINSIEKIQNQKGDLELNKLINSVDEYNSMQASINDNKISLGNDINNFYEDSVRQIQDVLDSKRIKNNEVEKIEKLINNYKLSKERYTINL